MFILKIDTTAKCSHLKLWPIPSSASHPYTSSSEQTVQLCERHDSYKPDDCKNLINRLHVHTCLYSCFRPKKQTVLCYILQSSVLLKQNTDYYFNLCLYDGLHFCFVHCLWDFFLTWLFPVFCFEFHTLSVPVSFT